MSMTVTNIDLGYVFLKSGPGKDELLTFAAAGTVKAGTILARSSATGKLVPYATAGADGASVVKYVAGYDIVATAAGDVPVRLPQGGEVVFERLIISADGDNSNITNAIRDALRAQGFVPCDVEQLARLDNQ